MSSDVIYRKQPNLYPGAGDKLSVSGKKGASLDILCVSRNPAVAQMAERVSEFLPFARVGKHTISNGHADPLNGLDKLPDLVIFLQGHDWYKELEEYAKRPPEFRPPLVVVGNANDPQALRAALKAGSRDFLSETADPLEMAQALRKIVSEIIQTHRGAGAGNLVAVLNAKGGSGASLLASNIAYLATVALHQRTVFVDLDLQFGSAGQYLDTPPRHGLIEALEMTDKLDDVALDGYVVKLESGLHVLSSERRGLASTNEMGEENLDQLLNLLCGNYQQVIVDVPRCIDGFTTTLLERCDRITVVVQQYITNIRDAARLLQILTTELGIDRSDICVVVNRYQSNAEISLDDIRKTLGSNSLITVPNDFRTVSDSLNKAVALYELARGKPITRAVTGLSEALTGISPAGKSGVLTRIKSWF